MTKLRPVAIHLPQFHPIPENDEWWGKGFTEWTNVTKARPLFKGHYQPHLPTDLGFYDLRLDDARLAQEQLAKEYGIYGFCYYHYWFNGKRILHEPVDRKLNNAREDLPFMLCWANENWTRIWDGSEREVLLEQKYSPEDHGMHIQALVSTFKDPRYIRIDGKAVFAIYRSSRIPDVASAIKIWRNEAAKHGVGLYVCRMESFGEGGADYLKDGFDAAIQFEPLGARFSKFREKEKMNKIKNKFSLWYLKYKLSPDAKRKVLLAELAQTADYRRYVDFLKGHRENHEYKKFPGVTPMWDNTPRKKENYFLFKNSTPAVFQEWVDFEIRNFTPFSNDENLFFINAWNEWAEGNHLEPCQKWGHDYLNALSSALKDNNVL